MLKKTLIDKRVRRYIYQQRIVWQSQDTPRSFKIPSTARFSENRKRNGNYCHKKMNVKRLVKVANKAVV